MSADHRRSANDGRDKPERDAEKRQRQGQRHEPVPDTLGPWDAKAAFWDERMGEGNLLHRELVGPTAERLLDVRAGELVLDVACGNGQFARRLASLGARVIAADFSAVFLERARARGVGQPWADDIEYSRIDATDEAALATLGEHRFDAVTCLMALMDIADLEPLARSLPLLLAPGGRFVFVTAHPAFNSSYVRMSVEQEDRGGELVTTRWLGVRGYLTRLTDRGSGMPDEPVSHWYFHRSLTDLLAPFLAAGMVLDALEEPTFTEPSTATLGWSSFTDIPPVLAARLRPR